MPFGETEVTPLTVGATLSMMVDLLNATDGLPAASVKAPAATVKVQEPVVFAAGVQAYEYAVPEPVKVPVPPHDETMSAVAKVVVASLVVIEMV